MTSEIQQSLKSISQFTADLSKNPLISCLKEYGRVFLVGGAIRSIIGNEKPNDVDLFVLMNPDQLLELVKYLESKKYVVSAYIKKDYEGWKLNDMIITTIRDGDMVYDVVIGDSFATHNCDFDVNSMFVELPSETQLTISHIKDGKLVEMTTLELIYMSTLIKNKQMNMIYNVEFLKKYEGTIYGSGQLMKRLIKRINYGWTLAENNTNITVAEYLLNYIHPNMYKQNRFRRESKVAIVNLMLFLMNAGRDLKTFIDERKMYFADILNYVTNKQKFVSNVDSYKKLMTYCDVQYVKWEE